MYGTSLFGDFSPVTTALIAIILVVVTILFGNYLVGPSLRGPGPWGIPVFGFYPFLKEDYSGHFTELAEKYGDTYLISLCGKLYVHLNSYKAVREAFVTKADCFRARSQDFSLFEYVFRDGIACIDGEAWRVLRKFLISSMRELGLGAKEQLKDPLFDSLKATLKALKESKEEPMDISHLLSRQCTDVIRRLVVGEDVNDDTAQKINDAYLKTLTPMTDASILLSGNIARYTIFPWIKGYTDLFTVKQQMDTMFQKILKDHRTNFDPEHPKDLIDLYLRERKLREDKGDPQAKYFTDGAFIPTLLQVYGDGGVSIGAVIASYLMVLADKIEVQDAIYEEIAREIGTDRLPTYEDRIRLPLVNSLIKELERTSPIIPVISSLVCNQDTTISGVFVPKGTATLVHFSAIHNDPAVYKNPQNFDMERFLPDPTTKRPKEELPMFFGVGRRACAGEALVATEVFMFLTALFQHFTIRFKDSDQSGCMKKVNMGFEDIAKQKFVAIPRRNST